MPIDPNKEYFVPADEKYGFAEQTYTAEEIMNFVGGDVKHYTDELLQEFAEVMMVNVEGDGNMDFNDCESDMVDDMQTTLLERSTA